MVFRPAVPGDAPELLRLNEAFNGPGGQTLAAVESALSTPGGERVFVAQEGDSLAGFCCCQVKRSFCYQEPACEVTEFFVDPPYRRQGAGRGLMAQVARLCRQLGVGEVTLLTGDDNLAAQAFYKDAGFSPSGELHMEADAGALQT